MVFHFTGSGSDRTVKRKQKKMTISLLSPSLLGVVVLEGSFLKELPVY